MTWPASCFPGRLLNEQAVKITCLIAFPWKGTSQKTACLPDSQHAMLVLLKCQNLVLDLVLSHAQGAW